jgi:Uri superfamily endonuclease
MQGTYLLFLHISSYVKTRVGSLGLVGFEPGMYIYIGSALNDIQKRITHHLRKKKKLHWHIDYLTVENNVRIVRVLYKESTQKEECEIAHQLHRLGCTEVAEFGCSDCKCTSHLIRCYGRDLQDVESEVKSNIYEMRSLW